MSDVAIYKCINKDCLAHGLQFRDFTLSSSKNQTGDFPRCPDCKRYAALLRVVTDSELAIEKIEEDPPL